MTQYSRIRYGTLRRFLRFLDEALGGREAWAGGEPKYKSILEQRRTIYRSEAERKGVGEISPGSFPLVGERYRFKRILVDRDQPRISIVYAANTTVTGIRWIAVIGAFALTLVMCWPRRKWWNWLIPLVGFPLLLLVGHYILGVHKRLLWGIDLALIASIARLAYERSMAVTRKLLWSPWEIVGLLTWRNLCYVSALAMVLHVTLKYPLLLSTIAMIALFTLWHRLNVNTIQKPPEAPLPQPTTTKEVAHASA